MPVETYRARPVEIRAVEWTGDNANELYEFTEGNFFSTDLIDLYAHNWDREITGMVFDTLHTTWVGVKTGQHIIEGTEGEFYPCDAVVLEAKYEKVSKP